MTSKKKKNSSRTQVKAESQAKEEIEVREEKKESIALIRTTVKFLGDIYHKGDKCPVDKIGELTKLGFIEYK
tara:strand:+ start:548 stop:763 length:216 start_codon:yes stop_codon:yes gene_type:complete